MSFLLNQLIDRFYPGKRNRYCITLAGLPGAGKTSLMFLLKEQKFITTTIPTPGFTVDVVNRPTLSNDGSVQMALGEMEIWDTGMMGGFHRHYFSALHRYARNGGDALVWVVSGIDGKYDHLWGSSDEQLRIALEFIEDKEPEDLKPKRRPLLILVNKQDLPDAKSMNEMRKIFGTILENRPHCAIFPISVMRGLVAESGIPQAFDWLHTAIGLSRKRAENSISLNAQKSQPSLPSQYLPELKAWFSRLRTDNPPDEFLLQFNNGTLPKWDHYSRIRVIFHVLRKYGRDDGEKFLLEGLERLAQENTIEGEAFHFTMSCFWIQIIHFSIISTSFPTEEHGIRKGDFIRLLAVNPFVVNDKLWQEYYSEGVMQSQDAKRQLALPDKKPFPSFVARQPLKKV